MVKPREIWQGLNTLLMGVGLGGMFEVPKLWAAGLVFAVGLSSILEKQRLSDWIKKKP